MYKNNKRIILIGKAGSGKDYFRDYLKDSARLDVSYTTRPPRKGEVDGYTYNYITEEEFLAKKEKGFFLEAVNFNGWWYGTSNENWKNKNLFIMTPSGTLHVPKEDRESCTFVYFDIPLNIRRERLSKRSDSDSVDRRIKADEIDFKDLKDFNVRVTKPEFNCASLFETLINYVHI
jgi:guanylate kinase